MSRHEGVSCDSCSKSNFRGKRYKCLICFDYDLCSTCYDNGTTTTRHGASHPMQCIITRSDFELFYGGESLQFDQSSSYSFVCPYCGEIGYSETQLLNHVNASHSNVSTEVICPICATLPGGDPNHVTDSLCNHLATEHRIGVAKDLLEEPLSRNIRRIFHPVRNIPPPRSRRTAHQFSSNSTASSSVIHSTPVTSNALFSSARESMDPIAELLSQLSGVRRAAQQQSAATTASQLQLLQQQLQFERKQVQQARERLERLPKKESSQNKTKTSALKVDQGKYLLNRSTKEKDAKTSQAGLNTEELSTRQSFTKELFYAVIPTES